MKPSINRLSCNKFLDQTALTAFTNFLNVLKTFEVLARLFRFFFKKWSHDRDALRFQINCSLDPDKFTKRLQKE
ncbi:CLUMA_CG000617, isoform A [Clunio marinus]|uniref:CLUMA_CG000617, isoform A n=1 Tax=Clunio marinus TaxID=568069 RepID=A0A1J1HGV1_9DIPT|nr:CLUMA_CG000617, isoform A [Clunio marinus]